MSAHRPGCQLGVGDRSGGGGGRAGRARAGRAQGGNEGREADLPAALLCASSTLRELYGITAFIAAVTPLLRGGRFLVFLDSLGCVFILGGVVPEAAIGGLAWGEYVTGGSPDPELQRLALQLFEAQLAGGFSLQAVW